MKIKYFFSKEKIPKENEEVKTEEISVEEKETGLTVLSTLLICIGSAILFSGFFWEKDSEPRKNLEWIGLPIAMVGALSVWLDIEKDRFRLFKKFFQCFPDRIYKILFSVFPYWPIVFFPFQPWLVVLERNEKCLFLKVSAQVFYWFLVVFAIVRGYRETREKTELKLVEIA